MSAVNDFLLRHRLCAAAYDWEEQLARFMGEMDSVRGGHPGSLKMIPMALGTRPLPEAPVTVAAIDIGGTNVRSALVTLDRGGVLAIDRRPAFRTPGIGRRTRLEDFYRALASGIGDHLAADRVGICFSLAAAPLPDGDAVVTAGAKQLDVPGLVGSRVGAGLRDAAASLGLACSKRFTVVNDTLAAALGGRLDAGNDRYSGFVGFIYGTGTNTAYREPSGALINVESGAYCGFPTGDIDDRYDRGHIDPGCDRFEKMVSGGYQGGLMALVLEAAEAEGLLSPGFSQRLADALAGAALASSDISAFAGDPLNGGPVAAACASGADRSTVASIIGAMTGRSALLCGVTVTAALLKAGIGRSADAPAFITAEGSTYLRQPGFRRKLEACMAEYAAKRRSLYYEFHTVPDAVMKGTAVAAYVREA
ncbi:MAG: hypothetical protein IJH86_00235 [Clostridia bacterium]|nr:hypothetical protein [Clostridia bacterium]